MALRTADRPKKARRARAPHALLRAVLLLLGIAMVVGLGVLLAAHRFAARSPAPAAATRTGDLASPQDRFRGEGFSYTQYNEDEPIFTIRAENIREDRRETAFLTGVELVLYRQDGQTIRVTSDEADYSQRTQEAELRGRVELRSDDLTLDARALRLIDGRVLASTGAVAFRYASDLVGRASGLRIDLDQERYAMSGGVHLKSAPGAPISFTLDCLRLMHDRAEGVVRAVGEVRLERDDDRLEAESLTLFFADELRQLESLRAKIGVRAEMVLHDDDPEEHRVILAGSTLEARLDPQTGNPTRVELESAASGADGVVRFGLRSESGLLQSFVGRYLVAYLEGGEMRLIEAYGDPLVLGESLDLEPAFPLRRACAGRAEARFGPGGELGRVRLESQVEIADRELFIAGGAQATIDWAEGKIEVDGPEVALLSPRAEVTASRFVYRRDLGLIRAENGVRAVLPDVDGDVLGATPLARGEGPVQVEAERANWTLDPPSFAFLGNVRAWRGQSLVLADQLRGDDQSRQLTASGPLKTVWIPTAGSGVAGQPIEVSAAQMSYRGQERELVYSGGVQAQQAGRRLSCRELTVELDDRGQAQRLRCSGEVRLVDPVAQRQVEGERALYTLAEQRVEVFGDEVRYRESGGNGFVSKYLIYDVATGAVEVKSAPPGAPRDDAATVAEAGDEGDG